MSIVGKLVSLLTIESETPDAHRDAPSTIAREGAGKRAR
jgi:hypothetical protein